MVAYQMYSELLLPWLLKVYNIAWSRQQLPLSMSRTSSILLLKPDKSLIDPTSYWPLSVLQLDIKILAKALARRLNSVIADIVHADQESFMPNKSTAINLRHLYVTMQTPAENIGTRALLSLDANKVFDIVEWRWGYLWALL